MLTESEMHCRRHRTGGSESKTTIQSERGARNGEREGEN